MARRKHSMEDRSMEDRSMEDRSMQMTSANPIHNFPSSEDVNSGNDVSQRHDSLNRETSLSIFEMGPAHPALEALGSGVCLSPRTTPLSENWSTSNTNENEWTTFGNQWSYTSLYQLPYEHLNIQSQFSRLETQNGAIKYLNPLPADPAPGPWNATGYNPVRTDDILVGILGAQPCERDYHVHPTMQESDSSGISSLSSSYRYNCPESQLFAIGHEPLSLVPWSCPNTVEETFSGSLPQIQGPGLSAQRMSNPFSERAVSDERLSTTPAHIVHALPPDIAVTGHQIVWNSSDGQEVKIPKTPRRRSTQQREETNKIRERGACRRCRKGRRKCHLSHEDRPALRSPDSSSPWSLVSDGSSSFGSMEFPTPSPVHEDQPP